MNTTPVTSEVPGQVVKDAASESALSESVLFSEARPPLTDAARRALAEAEERKRRAEKPVAAPPPEFNGRGGLDPARFGDWEVKGLAVDF
jgi:hypothetical protein